jgi:hypothetical protein
MNRKPLLCSLIGALTFGCSGRMLVDDAIGTGGTAGTGGAVGTGGTVGTGGFLFVDAGTIPAGPPALGFPVEPGVTNNPAECPALAPSGICNATEGLVCTYRGTTNGIFYDYACGCWAGNRTELWWGCSQMTGSELCPESEPAATDSCFGARGVECGYAPREICTCSTVATDPLWECATLTNAATQLDPPASVNPATPLDAMSDADRQAWCRWYVDLNNGGPGYPEPNVGGVDANGYLYNVGCNVGWDFYDLAQRPTVPTVYCEQNLALTTCELTVSDLTDCILSVINSWPSPRGCGRYLDTPGCSGTIVSHNLPGQSTGTGGAPGDLGCTLRVR